MPGIKKRLLVVGSGGREHALVWKLKQSKDAGEIFCAPGNAGIAEIATCLPCSATDSEGLVKLAKEYSIDFTIIGMDDPLVMGIVDVFEANGLKVFGPDRKAAEIEGSKIFAKNFMKRNNIPTANFEVFDSYDEALAYAELQPHPLVIKTDGLAAGKGAVISNCIDETRDILRSMMLERKFGSSGEKVVIEEFMEGKEVSVLAFCDGKTIVPMTDAQDYKKALDGDKGSNTGGMGSISPSRHYTTELSGLCMESIFRPTAEALRMEGRPFKGILYFGLMLTDKGVKVVEYNCRFGDPEAQAVLPRLEGDLLEIMLDCVDGRLDEAKIKWKDGAACCVILASGGYPGIYETGRVISGLDTVGNVLETDIPGRAAHKGIVFHAGTKSDGSNILTAGGRVLGVTAEGATIDKAVENAYTLVNGISFDGVYFRKDIGK